MMASMYKYNLPFLLLTTQFLTANSFTTSVRNPRWCIANTMMSSTATSASTDYDIVKVDLDNDRDYPIYIGDSFDDKQG